MNNSFEFYEDVIDNFATFNEVVARDVQMGCALDNLFAAIRSKIDTGYLIVPFTAKAELHIDVEDEGIDLVELTYNDKTGETSWVALEAPNLLVESLLRVWGFWQEQPKTDETA